MDEMTSSEFRKRYPRLTEECMVTVNGHKLGMWTPEVAFDRIELEVRTRAAAARGEVYVPPPKPVHVAPLPAPRPFTPAPKPGKR